MPTARPAQCLLCCRGPHCVAWVAASASMTTLRRWRCGAGVLPPLRRAVCPERHAHPTAARACGGNVAAKIKTNVRGLDVLSAVYAFAMALGLTQVFLGSQTFLTKILSGTAPIYDQKTLLIVFLFINVTLLGLRFFWVPRNLQSLVIAAARFHAIAPPGMRERGGLSSMAIAFHLVMIFLHGALFYLVCAEFEYVAFALSSNLPLSSSIFMGYILMHVSLLLMNAAWIALARWQEVRLERQANDTVSAEAGSAGNVWWRNNLVCSLLALAPFAISSTCKSASLECARLSAGSPTDYTMLLPTSPQVFATVYYEAVEALAALGLSSPHMPVYWVLAALFANSAYDLLQAGRYYVFFEDVEWEEVVGDRDHRGPIG